MGVRNGGRAIAVATEKGRDLWLEANRLRHHLLEWGGEGPVVVLLHGFLEHAHTWDFVAPRLAAAGFHVFALDWRGHGDSDWVGAGGYYHFADYTADLAFLLPQLGERVALVAHSMGGGVAVTYAGTVPDRVWALVSVEGLGVPDSDPDTAAERMRVWIEDLGRAATRPRRPLSLTGAARRLRQGPFRFPLDAARHLAEHGTRRDGAGARWKFDPLHQTRSPQPYYVSQAKAFWRRIDCPVLYVEGDRSPLVPPATELARRLHLLRAKRVSIEAAGHHPHLEQPQTFADAVLPFLRHAGASSSLE